MNHARQSTRNCSVGNATAYPRFALKALCLGMVLGFAATSNALPTAGTVVSGNATINNSGNNSLTINQTSANATFNWQSFNIGASESVRFVQPDANSVALNRVLGSDPSRILGNLTANGKVFLINPNGVLFGSGASVNVGGLVASALDITDADFMAGRYRFDGTGTGDVNNLGAIRAADGGYVALLGNRATNQGTITARLGTVALAAGRAVTLDVHGDGLLQAVIDKPVVNALASNGGLIQADGGQVVLTAAAKDALLSTVVNNTGIVQANTVANRGGRIVLDGGDSGGVNVGGSLQARGVAPGATGGTVIATGDKVLVADQARIDATGSSGGGSIFVGGGWQGQDPTIRQATGVFVSQSATLDASATQNGNGGTVVAWSKVPDAQSSTRVFGSLLARGGAESGDGGRIETSGHWLNVAGIHANAAAPHGKAGQWLLDPEDMVVGLVATDAAFFPGPVAMFLSGPGAPDVFHGDIEAQLNAGTAVVLQTAPTGAGNGDISITTNITKTAGGSTGLALNAIGSITFSPGAAISSTSGGLDVLLGSGQNIVFSAGSNIASNGGNVGMQSGGNIVFSGANNIASNGGMVAMVAGGGISVSGSLGFTNSVDMVAGRSVSIGSGASISAGAGAGYIAISAPSFSNGAGPGAVSTVSGRWIIYTSDPSVDAFGGLVSGNPAIWGQNYSNPASGAIGSGNRYVFSTPGTINVTTTSPAAKPYGQTISVANNVTYTGLPLNSAATYGNVYQDVSLSDVFSTLPTVSSAGTNAKATAAGGPYPVIASGGIVNPGFSINYVNSGLLTIDRAILEIIANPDSKTYNGQPYIGGNGVTYSGFLDGDGTSVLGGSLLFVGSSQNAVNAGTYSIVPSGLTSSNYSIQFVSAPLVIKPKVVSVSGLLADNKDFDGNTSASIRSWGSVATGVGQETLVLNHGSASFTDPVVGFGKTVTASGYSLADGQNGGLASNYLLSSTTATTVADIVVAGSAQAGNQVQTWLNRLFGFSGSDTGHSSVDADANGFNAFAVRSVDGTPVQRAPIQTVLNTVGLSNMVPNGRVANSGSGATAAGGSRPGSLGGTAADAQGLAVQGTSRFSTSGLSSKPTTGKPASGGQKPTAPEKIFLKGAATASAVGVTSTGAVLVASITGSGNTHKMAITVAAGEGFEMSIPKSFLGVSAGAGNAASIVGQSLTGGPLPAWISFSQALLSLVARSVPSTGLPLTVKLVGPAGKLVEVTFK